MSMLWGSLMAAIGLFLAICGYLQSDFIVYRLIAARSKMLWGEKTHAFHTIAGTAIVILGILMALGVIWQK